MNCLFETIAAAWVGFLRFSNPRALEDDLETSAREDLQTALGKASTQLGVYSQQLTEVAKQVRERRSTLPKPELKKLLLRSRRIKAEQQSLENKIRLMESQLNALENNEFNKVVISTLQTSSKAMQRMGLNKDLMNTDQVISELEEGMQFSSDVSQALSGGIGGDNLVDDADLDAELGEILGEETLEPVFATHRPDKPPEKHNEMPQPVPEPSVLEEPVPESVPVT